MDRLDSSGLALQLVDSHLLPVSPQSHWVCFVFPWKSLKGASSYPGSRTTAAHCPLEGAFHAEYKKTCSGVSPEVGDTDAS